MQFIIAITGRWSDEHMGRVFTFVRTSRVRTQSRGSKGKDTRHREDGQKYELKIICFIFRLILSGNVEQS